VSRSSGQSSSAVRSNPSPAPSRVAVPRGSQGAAGSNRSAPTRARQAEGAVVSSRSADNGGQAARRPTPAPPPDGRYSRPREGQYPTGQAVRRPPGSYPGYRPPGHYPGYYPPYYRPYYPNYWGAGWYYPWGVGAWGFYAGWPYWGYGGYYGPSYAYVYSDIGSLRLLVKPREAHVYVDGYYVGIVDEFDGTFQRLELPEGPHRIEVRLDGFATLTYDVRVIVNHTIKLRGVLQPLP
jgi:hypothetical protein